MASLVERMQVVAIAGTGLIGGSFGLALRAAGFQGEILGISSPSSIEKAIHHGAIDRGATLAEAAGRADLLYLAQPVGRILAVIRELPRILGERALVTDVGSTKQIIVDAARKYLPPGSFIGGHPMAGKESRGVDNAGKDLFRGRTYVLTPLRPEDIEDARVQDLLEWIRRIGAREVIMGSEEHDYRVAYGSHLPQLASTALAATLSQTETLTGPGARSTTRLALSAFDIWRDILATNAEPITEALTAYIQELEHIRENLRTRAIEEEFERGAAFARGLE
jgi:prephenate dehydrogenase